MGLFGSQARQGRDQKEAQLESTGTWFDQRPDTVSQAIA